MQSDWADAALRRHWLRDTRAARARYEQLVTEAVARGELRAGTDAQVLVRMIEVTLCGSFLAWTLHREGAAATRLREDSSAVWSFIQSLAPPMLRPETRREPN